MRPSNSPHWGASSQGRQSALFSLAAVPFARSRSVRLFPVSFVFALHSPQCGHQCVILFSFFCLFPFTSACRLAFGNLGMRQRVLVFCGTPVFHTITKVCCRSQFEAPQPRCRELNDAIFLAQFCIFSLFSFTPMFWHWKEHMCEHEDECIMIRFWGYSFILSFMLRIAFRLTPTCTKHSITLQTTNTGNLPVHFAVYVSLRLLLNANCATKASTKQKGIFPTHLFLRFKTKLTLRGSKCTFSSI